MSDYIADAKILYYYHCDPLELTIAQYNNLLEKIVEIQTVESGMSNDPQIELAKMMREKKDKKIYP